MMADEQEPEVIATLLAAANEAVKLTYDAFKLDKFLSCRRFCPGTSDYVRTFFEPAHLDKRSDSSETLQLHSFLRTIQK